MSPSGPAEPAAGSDAQPRAVLTVSGLDVDFALAGGGPAKILSGVDLRVGAGQVLGILGESGCGKTTLARAILGILPAETTTRGSIRLDGRELLGRSEKELERIRGREVAMISQEPGLALSPVLKVGSQIADVLWAHRGVRPTASRPEVERLLSKVRFPDPGQTYDAYPHELSGGQLQRMVVARALAGAPRLLIADEPTSSVDATTQLQILDILRSLRRELGLAILFITHDPALLGQIADQILVLYAGRVAEVGSNRELLHRPLHPYTHSLLACAPRWQPVSGEPGGRLPTIGGAPPDPWRPSPGCCFEPRCPERINQCAELEPPAVEPAAGRVVRCLLYGD